MDPRPRAIGSNDASLVMDVIPFLIEYAAHPENIQKELVEVTHTRQRLDSGIQWDITTTNASETDWERDACIDAIGMIGERYPESVKDSIPMLEEFSTNASSPYTIKKALSALNAVRRT